MSAIKPQANPTDVTARIENSFTRLSSIDASKIVAWSSGGEVTLRGTVRSWSERNEAETAPGVWIVHNHLTVFDG
ncbi:MAG: BON domain-containing protein [Pseudonocardiaceae bacterium]